MYFDTHAHYFDERFASELSVPVDTLLRELLTGEVFAVINAGTNAETSKTAACMAEAYPRMYFTAGLHPIDCQYTDPHAALLQIEELLKGKHRKLVAVGEIGLDYHYDDTDKERQAAVFAAQMALAERYGLPVVIHDRDAHEDVLEMIRRFPRVRGVLHSFSGSEDMARELVRRGYMISFSGSVTYGKKPARVAASVPLSHLLIETDAPYLPPAPLRGSLNHSGNLVYTAQRLAELHNLSLPALAEATRENACRFFNIPV